MYTYFSKMMLLRIMFVMIFLITPSLSGNVLSEEIYPDRPITVICSYGAGGATDVTVRTICSVAEKELGQPIMVENKSGAAGTIGLAYGLKSKPDGYTLVLTTATCYYIAPLFLKVAFDPLTDLTVVVPISKFAHQLAVRSDSPLKTFEDVIKYAKENPGRFTFASTGISTSQNICLQRVAKKEGIILTMIPFKSGSEAALACLGGHTVAVAEGPPDLLPHVWGGKLRLVLSLNDFRWRSAPDVPNILEKGYGFYAWSTTALLSPKGLPEPIRRRLEDVFNKAKKDPAFTELMGRFGMEIITTQSTQEYEKFWRSQYHEMKNVVEELGLAGKK